jgi:hypothetical protein
MEMASVGKVSFRTKSRFLGTGGFITDMLWFSVNVWASKVTISAPGG